MLSVVWRGIIGGMVWCYRWCDVVLSVVWCDVIGGVV